MSAEVPYGLTAAAAGATIAVSIALVTIAHRQGSGYPQAFRLMRGAVSLVLTLLGFFALVEALSNIANDLSAHFAVTLHACPVRHLAVTGNKVFKIVRLNDLERIEPVIDVGILERG